MLIFPILHIMTHYCLYLNMIPQHSLLQHNSLLLNLILSPIQPETIANRLSSEYEAAEEEESDE